MTNISDQSQKNLMTIYEHFKVRQISVDLIDKKSLSVNFTTPAKGITLNGKVILSENSESAYIKILIGPSLNEDQRLRVILFNAVVNERLSWGRFGLSINDSMQLNFSNAQILENQAINERFLNTLIGMGIITINEYLGCYYAVIEKGADPNEALKYYEEYK